VLRSIPIGITNSGDDIRLPLMVFIGKILTATDYPAFPGIQTLTRVSGSAG
jgi:hypothetical protein